MRFVFSNRFYLLLAAGLVPLSLSWSFPFLQTAVFIFDALLVIAAGADYFFSRAFFSDIEISRGFDSRFAIGGETAVTLKVRNRARVPLTLRLKDEYPPEMRLDDKRESEMALGPQTA